MPKDEIRNPNESGSVRRRSGRPFDLGERTALFGEAVIRFCKAVPLNVITTPLVSQLVRAGTSVGANYEEADDSESKRDFHHKIAICRKESRECKFFLRMLVSAEASIRAEARVLYQEAKELNLIFGSMRRTKRDADPKPPRP